MLRRQRILSFVLCFTITLMFSKCGYIMLCSYFSNDFEPVNRYVTDVASTRMNIYDRHGNKLVNDVQENTYLIKPTDKSIKQLKDNLNTDEFLKIQDSLLRGLPAKITTKNYINESSDIKLVKTYKRYSDDNILRHIIGYTDVNGNGVCGIEKAYEKINNSSNMKISAMFGVSALNTVLAGEDIVIKTNDYYSCYGVKLTVDKNIQLICEEALDDCGVEKGAVVALDVETFDILALASRPNYNPEQIEENLQNEQSPLINRALSPYATGSVFKPVVAATAIEQGVFKEYECTGKVEVGNIVFNCHNEEGHGFIDLEDAISQSCNTYFINLANAIDKNKLIETAERMGFGKSLKLCDGIISESGNLPTTDEIDSPAALANLSFGQGSLTSTPLQIASMTATIANGGNYINPGLIIGTVDSKGKSDEFVREAPVRVLNESTCEVLVNSMKKALLEGTGKKAQPINTTAGVKTSTAENADGGFNSWVTGFFPADSPKYVVTVIKEDGTSGGEDCGPIFKRIAEKITLLSR